MTRVSSRDSVVLMENTAELSDRETKIIKAIVQEYTETAESVGSDTLDRKYQIGVSPATIRNEMNRLTEKGYLAQPHTSSGRIPTSKAIKYYVQKLLEEKQLPVTDEIKVKQQIWDARGEVGRLMREVTHSLANQTHMLSVAATDQGDVYHAGYANILDIPEFFDIDVTRTVFLMIDEVNQLMEIFGRSNQDEALGILIGDELGAGALLPVSMVYTQFHLGGTNGAVGVLGPCRLDYSYVIPTVKYMGKLLTEIGVAW